MTAPRARRTSAWVVAASVAVLFLLVAISRARSGRAPSPARAVSSPLEPHVPDLGADARAIVRDADEELALARASEAAVRAKSGRERLIARLLALDAWRAFAEHHPRHPEAAAAASRAGRGFAALGFADEARDALAAALALAPAGPAAVAARLEIAHFERRSGRGDEALFHYALVERSAAASRSARDTAALWSGRVHLAAGRAAEARRALERVLAAAEEPTDRIRAADQLALADLAAGDLDRAAERLAAVRDALAEAARELTPEGARVRRALVRMRAHVELALARHQGPPDLAHFLALALGDDTNDAEPVTDDDLDAFEDD